MTFLADELPTGDEKSVARDYAISFGGNAVTAAFCCARLGVAPDLLASVADDWLGRMFIIWPQSMEFLCTTGKGRGVVAVIHHAERRAARHRAMS